MRKRQTNSRETFRADAAAATRAGKNEPVIVLGVALIFCTVVFSWALIRAQRTNFGRRRP